MVKRATPSLGRRILRLCILLVWICPILASCAGSNGPEAAAHRYVDALMREDYAAAVDEVDTTRMGRPMVLSLLPLMHAELLRRSGGLKSVSVERMDEPKAEFTSVIVTWRGENEDITTRVELIRVSEEWKVRDMVGGAYGQANNGAQQGGSYQELPSVKLATPTPATYSLSIKIPELTRISWNVAEQASVEVLETQQNIQPNLLGNNVRLSAGIYTLRLKVPGRADSDSKVTIGAGRPTSVELRMGKQVPVNLATTVLLVNDQGNAATFATLSEDDLETGGGFGYWRVQGWDSLRTALHVADKTGLGKVGVDGRVEYSWRVPEHLTTNWVDKIWAYRPDLAEIVYVENKDIFSLATRTGATPRRWTELGIFGSVSGWVDNDTVLVNTATHQNVLRRDGSTYSFREHGFLGGSPSIKDRRGAIRFVQHDGVLFQPGATELEDRVEVKSHYGGVFAYGWTSNNAYFLAHSVDNKVGASSGIVALAQDGSSSWIAPELVAAGTINYLAKSWAFEPYGSRMVLAWHAGQNTGIYVADAQHGATRIISLAADKVFWPAKDRLIYVVESGPEMGTWQLSPNGGQPRKLFVYRAAQASAAPNGDLLLIANRTLWRVGGEREAEMLGEEGTVDENVEIVWPELFDTKNK